jgi:beta-N-acetylhexosaminidase
MRRLGREALARAVTCRLLLVAGVGVLVAGCGAAPAATPTSSTSRPTTTTLPPTTATTPPTSTTVAPTTTAATTTTSLPRGWTETRLLAQLIMVGGEFSDIAASTQAVQDGVGGVVFFGAPPAGSGPSIASGIAQLENVAATPLLTATDEEGGEIARLASVIGAMPAPRQMAATMTTGQVKQLLTSQGLAMAALGVDMDLAPVLDTASPGDTIDDENQRSFSENGAVASEYGLAFIAGLEAGGVIPVAKHFPGLGHASGDTDLGPATDPLLSQLSTEGDLIPFQHAIAAGVPVVMMSNVTEPDWGSTPASLNPGAYGYLRSMGFRGMVITDSLDAGAISAWGATGPEAVVKAIEAGADMAMITTPTEFPAALADLEQAVSSGQLPMSQVEAAVDRILAVKKTIKLPG